MVRLRFVSLDILFIQVFRLTSCFAWARCTLQAGLDAGEDAARWKWYDSTDADVVAELPVRALGKNPVTPVHKNGLVIPL